MKKHNWKTFSRAEALVNFKMALNTFCFALLLFTVYLPYWLKIQVSHTYLYMVLIKGVRVLMCLAIASGFLSLMDVFLILIEAVRDVTYFYLSSALLSFITAFLGILGQSIFMVTVHLVMIGHFNQFFFEWVFYLGWGTFSLYLLSGSFILVRRYYGRECSRIKFLSKAHTELVSTSS